MSVFVVILLGIVQGLTEFLPISSSGHLVLLKRIFGIQTDLIIINVFLHIGSLLAVVIYYRKTLWGLIKKPFQKTTLLLFLATVPTVIIVLCFNDFIESSFGGQYLAFGFMLTAIFMVIASFDFGNKGPINKKTATIMGVMQGIATLPGISRSGSTLTCGIVCGKDRKKVADFSFLMSIPVILGSLIFELVKIKGAIVAPWYLIITGMFFSFVFGYIAIAFMIKIIQKAKLYYFSIYLVVLAVVLLFVF